MDPTKLKLLPINPLQHMEEVSKRFILSTEGPGCLVFALCVKKRPLEDEEANRKAAPLYKVQSGFKKRLVVR